MRCSATASLEGRSVEALQVERTLFVCNELGPEFHVGYFINLERTWEGVGRDKKDTLISHLWFSHASSMSQLG